MDIDVWVRLVELTYDTVKYFRRDLLVHDQKSILQAKEDDILHHFAHEKGTMLHSGYCSYYKMKGYIYHKYENGKWTRMAG